MVEPASGEPPECEAGDGWTTCEQTPADKFNQSLVSKSAGGRELLRVVRHYAAIN